MSALAAIHVAKKQLGLDDDTARDLYARVTGKRSLRDMNPREQDRVVQELRKQGFKASEKGLQGPFAKKLQALWIAAWNLGIVHDRRDGSMLAFIKRQTGIDHTRFLIHAEDAAKAIEALKGWMTREAKVRWSVDASTPDWLKLPGAQIAVAQWNVLVAAEAVRPNMTDFRKLVAEMAIQVDLMTERDWQPVMNHLGEQIRKVRK